LAEKKNDGFPNIFPRYKSMYLTQGAVTNAMALLVQISMIYNLCILPLRFVYKMPVYNWTELADQFTDRVLVFDVLMSCFDMFVEDGEIRNVRVVQQLFGQEWFYFFLHVIASIDASVSFMMPFFPRHVSLRAIKLLRLPHFMTAIIPISDISKRILSTASLLV
jgi:hypothetical protein